MRTIHKNKLKVSSFYFCWIFFCQWEPLAWSCGWESLLYATHCTELCIRTVILDEEGNSGYANAYCECDRLASECFLQARRSYTPLLFNINTGKYCKKSDLVYCIAINIYHYSPGSEKPDLSDLNIKRHTRKCKDATAFNYQLYRSFGAVGIPVIPTTHSPAKYPDIMAATWFVW